jgi:NADP-dependent 3-hydroxy acid dehydrogenase YdfG
MASAINAEEAGNGIRITSIFPGEINTPILDERPVKVPDEQKARMVHPEDIASLIVAIAQLPQPVVVPELIIKPTYQEFI